MSAKINLALLGFACLAIVGIPSMMATASTERTEDNRRAHIESTQGDVSARINDPDWFTCKKDSDELVVAVNACDKVNYTVGTAVGPVEHRVVGDQAEFVLAGVVLERTTCTGDELRRVWQICISK